MTSARALRARRGEAAPRHVETPEPRHLEVVPSPTTSPGRAYGRVGAVAACLVFAGLFALAAFHTVLVSGQVRLDRLQDRVATQQEEYQRARLEVAALEAPQRIVDEARTRLGMVVPTQVVHLTPEQGTRRPEPQLGETADDAWLEIKPYLEPST